MIEHSATTPFYTDVDAKFLKTWQELYATAVGMPLLEEGDRFMLMTTLNSCRQIVQSNAAQRMKRGASYTVEGLAAVPAAAEKQSTTPAPTTISDLKRMNERRVSAAPFSGERKEERKEDTV